MTKDPGQQKRPPTGGTATAADTRGVAQRRHKEDQAAPLSAANVEESPHMDRGDSGGGSGQSLGDGRDSANAADALRGALDTQYGTNSSMKTGQKSAGKGGRVASAGSGSSGAGEQTQPAPSPGSSAESSGAERDAMTGSRTRSRA